MISKLKRWVSHCVDVTYNKYYLPQIIYRKKQRKRLTNTQFSLLTGNCIGGYLYHQLGLRFTSPTINMMILNKDFMKLVMDLRHYLSLSPVPHIDDRFPNVPSALLGDIVLHFTHYNSPEEGIRAWETRKQRLNLDNLYIIISDIDLTKKDIEEIGEAECKKIVVMTANNYGYDHCLYIPEYKGREHVGELLGKTLSGKWRFEKYFDFVGWVNSENPVAQKFYIGKL